MQRLRDRLIKGLGLDPATPGLWTPMTPGEVQAVLLSTGWLLMLRQVVGPELTRWVLKRFGLLASDDAEWEGLLQRLQHVGQGDVEAPAAPGRSKKPPKSRKP